MLQDTHHGRPKEELFGWNQIEGPKGRFMNIPKKDLLIDYSYQRETSMLRNKIAAEFNNVVLGTLIVSKREDGKYYVMDGHQRLEAARSRSDVSTLPCMVYEMENVKDEAKVFDKIQTNRDRVSRIHRFQVRLTYEDPVALGIQKILDLTGHTVKNDDTSHAVRCIGAIERCYLRNARKFEEYWPFIVRICEGSIHESILKGIFFLVASMNLDLNKDKNKLILAGREKLIRSINNVAALADASIGDKIAGMGIAKILNIRRRDKIIISLE